MLRAIWSMLFGVETGFSYNHSIRSKFIEELRKILDKGTIDDVIYILSVNLYGGKITQIIFTSKAVYVKLPKIEYNDISTLSLLDDNVIVTTNQGNDHTIPTYRLNERCIYKFLQFTTEIDDKY